MEVGFPQFCAHFKNPVYFFIRVVFVTEKVFYLHRQIFKKARHQNEI